MNRSVVKALYVLHHIDESMYIEREIDLVLIIVEINDDSSLALLGIEQLSNFSTFSHDCSRPGLPIRPFEIHVFFYEMFCKMRRKDNVNKATDTSLKTVAGDELVFQRSFAKPVRKLFDNMFGPVD